MKKITGISIVELLIALALGLWLLGGIFICYLSSQRNYRIEQALAHMQETGRIVTHLLSQDIYTAGYTGCLPLSSLTLNQIASSNFNLATRIIGWHQLVSSAKFTLPSEIARNAVSRSDILLVQNMVPDDISIISAQKNIINFNKKPNYKVGDILIITNCLHAGIFEVTSLQGKSITITPELEPSNNVETNEIGHLATIFYYIRKTNRKNTLGMPIYALYRRDWNAPPTQAQEIAEGVEDMQLTFGVKKNNTTEYLPVQQLSEHDWQEVINVQIALLINSIDPVTSHSKEYVYNGNVHLSTDKLLRREWNTTITIREPIVLVPA